MYRESDYLAGWCSAASWEHLKLDSQAHLGKHETPTANPELNP